MLCGRQSRQGDDSPALLRLGTQDEAAGLKLLARCGQLGYFALGCKASRTVKGGGVVPFAPVRFGCGEDAKLINGVVNTSAVSDCCFQEAGRLQRAPGS